jgi:hypothetical protein
MFRGLTNLNTVIASEQFVYSITAQSITEIYIGLSASIQGLIHDTMHCDTFHETFFCGAYTLITRIINFCTWYSARDALLMHASQFLISETWNFMHPLQSASWYVCRDVYQCAWGTSEFRNNILQRSSEWSECDMRSSRGVFARRQLLYFIYIILVRFFITWSALCAESFQNCAPYSYLNLYSILFFFVRVKLMTVERIIRK